MITNLRTESGQSLLEVLTALGVAAIVVVALSVLAVSSLRNAQHARAQAEATKFVNEGIEQVRTVRDQQGWNTFSTFSVTPPNNCYSVNTSSTPWILQGETCGTPPIVGSTQFTREIQLEDASIDVVSSGCLSPPCPGRRVTVTVSWTDSFGPNTSQAATILTQWK